ncbi:transporter substrate-binding domain-containing protein [Polymorphospora sp. NPDC050346]|uniref:substrate-binding periplasmic protein n=1 Tax=Polymorphospora sp. NPDC050346 TaxID=3155780 RepID=UPI0033FE0FED
MRRLVAVLVALLLLATGCRGWPADAGDTLAHVRDGVLRVGVTENPPWTTVADDGVVAGAEARLVRRLAGRLGARVEWYPGSESTLMAAVKDRVLDLVIGGLDAKAPWTESASFTRPYVTTRTVVAARPGVEVPDDLDDVRVAVPAGTAEVAALAGEGAVVVPVPEVTGAETIPVVVGEWRVAALGLDESGHDLGGQDHVWAVPPGENGWQVEVERFLLGLSHAEVTRLLVEAERPGAGS